MDDEHDERDERERANWLVRGLGTAGRGVAAGGVWLGRKAAAGYRAVDPDVQRHLLQLPLLAHSLFERRDAAIAPVPDDGHPPLVFVHGLGGTRGNFLLMSWWFWLNGRKRSYRIGFGPDSSIAEQAAELARKVERVCAVNDAPVVDLVAHSLGGVVARLALQEHGLAPRVGCFVSLGVPHHGTYPARYANTDTLRALRPDSPLMRRLDAGRPPAGVRLVCCSSRNDLFVLPPESALLEGATAIDLTPATHYSYLLDPAAFVAVRSALDSGAGG